MFKKASLTNRIKLFLGLKRDTNFSCLNCANIFSVLDDAVPDSVRYGDEEILCPKCGKPAKISIIQSAEDARQLA